MVFFACGQHVAAVKPFATEDHRPSARRPDTVLSQCIRRRARTAPDERLVVRRHGAVLDQPQALARRQRVDRLEITDATQRIARSQRLVEHRIAVRSELAYRNGTWDHRRSARPSDPRSTRPTPRQQRLHLRPRHDVLACWRCMAESSRSTARSRQCGQTTLLGDRVRVERAGCTCRVRLRCAPLRALRGVYELARSAASPETVQQVARRK